MSQDLLDLSIGLIESSVCANDVVGLCRLLFNRQLRGYSQSRIVLADAVARHQSSKLRGRIACDHYHLVEVVLPPAFEEEGNISDREWVPRRVERREPFVGHFTHERMNDSFESLSRVGVRKHDRAELLSIQRAGRIADIRAEAANDLVQARRRRGDSIAGQCVRINRRHTKRLETRTYIALAGGNSTRKGHASYVMFVRHAPTTR